jgi:predicted ArsR family transcriptional regulator
LLVIEIGVIATLDDPVRRRLYDYVCIQDHDVSRSEAAVAVGVQRTLAAFHLDKLVEAGLLAVTFARPAGRGGPGAGRPAKLYRRAPGEHCLNIPQGMEYLGRRLHQVLALLGVLTAAIMKGGDA